MLKRRDKIENSSGSLMSDIARPRRSALYMPASNAKAVDSKEDPIVVVAYPDGRMGLKLPDADIEVLDTAAFEAKLAPIVAQQGGEMRVMVAAEGKAPYQVVLTAMDVLKKAKVKNVSLLTESGNAR